MRPLEILTGLVLFVALLEPLVTWRGKPRWLAFLPSVGLIVALAQILVEGYRWQMLPSELFALGLFALSLPRVRQKNETSRRRIQLVLGGAGMVLLILVVALPWLFPIPQLPTPNGEYQIGTVTYDWVDHARDEIYGTTPGAKREVMVQVWYPATPSADAKPEPWMDHLNVVGPAISRYLHLPDFFLDHLVYARTHAYANAPVSNRVARYPVVVYSHGWNGFRSVAANQMEALASHGYIAVAIDHTYGAMVTVFADGRIALNNPSILAGDPTTDAYQHATETLEATYASDVRFVLDQLGVLDAGQLDPRLAGKFDLARVGLFGHSTGGGAIILACSRDPRCKAGLGMDAWVGPVPTSVIPNPLTQPFMFMKSQVWATPQNDARLDEFYRGLTSDGYRLTIRGTQHYDFTLLPLLTPLAPYLKLKGPLDGPRVLQITDDYLVAFFDRYLMKQSVPLLVGASSNYPEVIFEKR